MAGTRVPAVQAPPPVGGGLGGFVQSQNLLAQANQIAAQREIARRRRKEEREVRGLQTLGQLGGALVGGITGGLPGAGIGSALGGQAGSILAGRPPAAGELLQTGLSLAALQQQREQAAARAQAVEGIQEGLGEFRTPVVPEAGAVGTAGELTPQQRRINAFTRTFSGLAPIAPEAAASGLLELAGSGQQTDLFNVKLPSGEIRSGLARPEAISLAQANPGAEIAKVGTSFAAGAGADVTGTERINTATNRQLLETSRQLVEQDESLSPAQRQAKLQRLDRLGQQNAFLSAAPKSFATGLRARGLPTPEAQEGVSFEERRSRATTAAELVLQRDPTASPTEIETTLQSEGLDPLSVDPKFFQNLPERRIEAVTRDFNQVAAQNPDASLDEIKFQLQGGAEAFEFVDPEAFREVAQRTATREQSEILNDATRTARDRTAPIKRRMSDVIELLSTNRDKLGQDQIEYVNTLLADLDEEAADAADAGKLKVSERVKTELSLRREYRQESADFTRMASAWSNIDEAFQQGERTDIRHPRTGERVTGTQALDYSIVANFVRLNDPSGRLSQGEVQSFNGQGDIAEEVVRTIRGFTFGDTLTEDMRARILNIAREQYLQEAKAHLARSRNIASFAQDEGLTVGHVVYPIHQALPSGVTVDQFAAATKRLLERREITLQEAEERLILSGIDPKGRL